MRVAIANQKGGVGKTTTAVNLAASLCERGHRCLLVDLDPQANATTGVGIDHRGLSVTAYDVVIEGKPARDAILKTDYEGLELLPSSIDLAGAELELVPAMARESKLRIALEGVSDDYDVTFVDCPPSLGLLTVNALTAADRLLIPIQCEYYALEGLSQLLRNIELVRAGLNGRLEIGGIVLTMYDARTKLSEQVAEEIRQHFPDRVFSTVVPRSVRLSEAPSYGQPAVTYDPSSRGSMAYAWLAEEFERRFLEGSPSAVAEQTFPSDASEGSPPEPEPGPPLERIAPASEDAPHQGEDPPAEPAASEHERYLTERDPPGRERPDEPGGADGSTGPPERTEDPDRRDGREGKGWR